MRALADTTIQALRAFPNAPGVRFRVYLRHKGWHPGDPDIVTDFSEYVVADSLGNIDWTLERSYAQLTPGDVQFKVRDTLDQFETVVARAPSPCEVQIWGAPAWGGAGDWAMLFHGYIEPSGITRAADEIGAGGEPVVPLKDVYAKSYLSARLDSLLALPLLGGLHGIQRLTDVVERLGSEAIAAGHEAIDYDIQERPIDTKNGRLVMQTWVELTANAGPLWLYKTTAESWHFYQHAAGFVWSLTVDRGTLRIIAQDRLVASPGSYARFHYWGANYVLLTVSRNDLDWTRALAPHELRMQQLTDVFLLRRSSAEVVTRWKADDHRLTDSGLRYKATGYCCVSSPAPFTYNLVLFYDPYETAAGAPFWETSYVAALVSEADLMGDSDPSWDSGRVATGYVAGGAGSVRPGSGASYVGATLIDSGKFSHLNRWNHAGVLTDLGHTITFGFLGVLWLDAEHELCAMGGRHLLYEGDTLDQSYNLVTDLPHPLTYPRPTYLNETRPDDATGTSAVGVVDSGGHYNIVHYWRYDNGDCYADFYRASDSGLDLTAAQIGYFCKLNWIEPPPSAPGFTGHFYGHVGSRRIVYVDARFFPTFDLTNGGPSDDETLRAFFGRLTEATGHMMFFPGRASTYGPIIWRVRPRHLQPPDYCLTARDVLADGIEIQGPRKLRVIVATQGATHAYPDTETAALLRQSELTISNDGIPLSVADDFAYWLWQLFDAQNRAVKCELDAVLHVEVGDSIDLALGAVDYFQGVVTRQSLSSATGRGQVELLCQAVTSGNRLTPKGTGP